jgi:hypothetical protein
MKSVYSHKYPTVNGEIITFNLGPWDIPSDITKDITLPFEKVFLSEIDPSDLPREKFSEQDAPRVFRAFAINIPGAFYEHVSEDLDTIGVIACQADAIVLLTNMHSVAAQERLFVVFASVYEKMAEAMQEYRAQLSSDAEERFLSFEPVD